MSRITILVAWDDKHLIGGKNKLPWHIPEDLKLFKKRTLGHSVIMGRNTFESIGKPLPERENIVITSRPLSGAYAVSNLEEAVSKAQESNKEIFIIGGTSVYFQALEKDIVDRILVSHIFGYFEGDKYFPVLAKRWTCNIIAEYDKFVVKEFTRIRNEKI
jgi:dihydrofolate reductase